MSNNDQNEYVPVSNDQQDLSNFPYVKEISNIDGIKKTKVIAWKSMYIGVLVLFIVDLFEGFLAYYFYTEGQLIIGILIMCPVTIVLIIFLFIPIGINCQIDYNSSNFTSEPFPVFPITYSCFKTSISFNEINNFYLFKFKMLNKKHYKIGINKKDGTDIDLITGQDASCSSTFDQKLESLPKIMNNWLVSTH